MNDKEPTDAMLIEHIAAMSAMKEPYTRAPKIDEWAGLFKELTRDEELLTRDKVLSASSVLASIAAGNKHEEELLKEVTLRRVEWALKKGDTEKARYLADRQKAVNELVEKELKLPRR